MADSTVFDPFVAGTVLDPFVVGTAETVLSTGTPDSVGSVGTAVYGLAVCVGAAGFGAVMHEWLRDRS